MKYELPSIELIVIEENNYLKFGEYLNDMQCDDTTNKLCLDDLEYVKKLKQENKQLKDNWDYIKKMLKGIKQEEFNINGYCGICTDIDIDFLLNKMQKLEQRINSNEQDK